MACNTMSNDTTYRLKFRHKQREVLEAVEQYLKGKHARWLAYLDRCKREGLDQTLDQLLGEFQVEVTEAAVTWGFSMGKITRKSTHWSVEAEAWANENPFNVPIAGPQSELEDLLQKFPDLDIRGRFRDEFGSGTVKGSQRISRKGYGHDAKALLEGFHLAVMADADTKEGGCE